MQLIKDCQIINDNFQFIDDDATLTHGDIIVSLATFKQNKEHLLSRDSKLGLRLYPGDDVAGIADDLPRIQLIELNFPDFADGRLFSTAWLLRSRYHYQGELRASGSYLPDQIFYLSRVGVNAFKPETDEELPVVMGKLKDFSVCYQTSVVN